MANEINVNVKWPWLVIGAATAMIGHKIHGSIFWSIADFFFAPLAWVKWLICSEVNVSIIKDAFAFFLK